MQKIILWDLQILTFSFLATFKQFWLKNEFWTTKVPEGIFLQNFVVNCCLRLRTQKEKEKMSRTSKKAEKLASGNTLKRTHSIPVHNVQMKNGKLTLEM